MRPATLLRHVRHLTGLSQRDLADRIGISKSSVARIESGERSDPLVDAMLAASRHLIPVPKLPNPSNELRAHLAQVPLDERIELALQARGDAETLALLDALPSWAHTVVLGDVARMAWSLPERGPKPRLVLGVGGSFPRYLHALDELDVEFCPVRSDFWRQCYPANEWQPQLASYYVPGPFDIAAATIDIEMLLAAMAFDAAPSIDRQGRRLAPHRPNQPEDRFQRERDRLLEWGPGRRAARILTERELRARERIMGPLT